MNKRLEVTTGRLIALIIGIPLCLIAIGMAGVSEAAVLGQASYPVRLSLPARGRPVAIGVDMGSLRVVPAVGDHLLLNGTAHYALVRATVRWQATSAGITVESHCRFPNWFCSFDYHVGIPAGVSVDFSAGKGDITATGLTNPVVTAASGSGDITLRFSKVPEMISIQDSFGDVRVVLPPGSTPYRVSTQAPFGTISVTVPTSPSSAHVINVDDSSGNIWITR